MICDPCREPHEASDCIDVTAGREYPWRHCACQHHLRATPAQSTDQHDDSAAAEAEGEGK